MWMTNDLACAPMQAGSGGSGGAGGGSGGADSNGNHDFGGALEGSHSAIFGGSGGGGSFGGSGGGFGGSFGGGPMENGNTSAPAAVCPSHPSSSLRSGLAHGRHVWWLGHTFSFS